LCPHDILLYGPYDFFDSILPVHKEKSHYYFTDRAVSGLGMTLTWPCHIAGFVKNNMFSVDKMNTRKTKPVYNSKLIVDNLWKICYHYLTKNSLFYMVILYFWL